MRTIDLKKIVSERQLDKDHLAGLLFPKNKYPKLSLNRVIKGKAKLDSQQVSKLAMLLGVKTDELYDGRDWTQEEDLTGIIFSSGDYHAKLDTRTWVTRIFHKNSLFHESILHGGAISMEAYLSMLNDKIINHS